MRHLHLRERSHTRPMTGESAVTLRLASPDDAARLAELAALDSLRPPPGPVLLADVDGELRVALSPSGGAAVADPSSHSRPSRALTRAGDRVALIQTRANELDTLAENHLPELAHPA